MHNHSNTHFLSFHDTSSLSSEAITCWGWLFRYCVTICCHLKLGFVCLSLFYGTICLKIWKIYHELNTEEDEVKRGLSVLPQHCLLDLCVCVTRLLSWKWKVTHWNHKFIQVVWISSIQCHNVIQECLYVLPTTPGHAPFITLSRSPGVMFSMLVSSPTVLRLCWDPKPSMDVPRCMPVQTDGAAGTAQYYE